MSSLLRRSLAVFCTTISSAAMAQAIGPSTTKEPFVLPSVPGVITKSILTTGDSVKGYRMVGVPDGIGVLEGKRGTFDIVLNHELGRDKGIPRSHGSKGSFVSRWTLDRSLNVLSGRDHIANQNSLFLASNGGWTAGTTAFDRFCSADLGASRAYSHGVLGTSNRIFLNGEENSPPAEYGRVFAHILTGPDVNKTFQLPHLGRGVHRERAREPVPAVQDHRHDQRRRQRQDRDFGQRLQRVELRRGAERAHHVRRREAGPGQ